MPFAKRLEAATRKSASAMPTITADELNKRWAKRKSSNTPAKILFAGITTPFECSVRDISSTGAQIEMTKGKFNPDASTEAIPTQFTLLIAIDRISVECQSMWRRGSKMGIRFTGMVKPLPQHRAPSIRTAK